MAERLDELVRTTLGDLAPVDVPALARRARRRRRSRRGALVGGVSLIVVLLAAAVVLPGHDDESQQVVTRPDGLLVDGDPIGRWTEGAAAPLSPRVETFADDLDDGRVLVWGGVDAEQDAQGGAGGIPYFLPDGAIYDPGADTWEAIPPVPLPDGDRIIGPSGIMFFDAQIEGETLAIVGTSDNSVIDAAVYDIAERTWSVAPAQNDLDGYGVDIAWDGTTLVLVRTGRGELGETFETPGPFTRRWSPGETQWTTGTPPPLAGRSFATDAYDNGRLALFGGTTTRLDVPGGGTDTDPDPGAVRDGAIYDIATDEWTDIPPPPPPVGDAHALTWRSGELLIGGDIFERSIGTSRYSALAAYNPDTRTWRALAPSPAIDDGSNEAQSTPNVVGGGLPQGEPPLVIADGTSGFHGDHPWYLLGDTWEQAPFASLVAGDDLAIAVSNQEWDRNVSDTESAELAVRQAPGRWSPGVTAPFVGPWEAGVVTNDRVLVALSQAPAHSDDPDQQTWVFDPED